MKLILTSKNSDEFFHEIVNENSPLDLISYGMLFKV